MDNGEAASASCWRRAGSAIGLGNIWKFPYVTGENGGGLFVLIYLVAVALVGLPIMMAEVYIGRTTQLSPVGAFRKLASRGSPWIAIAWMGVSCAFIILSYYAVVAGWTVYYVWLSATGAFAVSRTPKPSRGSSAASTPIPRSTSSS